MRGGYPVQIFRSLNGRFGPIRRALLQGTCRRRRGFDRCTWRVSSISTVTWYFPATSTCLAR